MDRPARFYSMFDIVCYCVGLLTLGILLTILLFSLLDGMTNPTSAEVATKTFEQKCADAGGVAFRQYGGHHMCMKREMFILVE